MVIIGRGSDDPVCTTIRGRPSPRVRFSNGLWPGRGWSGPLGSACLIRFNPIRLAETSRFGGRVVRDTESARWTASQPGKTDTPVSAVWGTISCTPVEFHAGCRNSSTEIRRVADDPVFPRHSCWREGGTLSCNPVGDPIVRPNPQTLYARSNSFILPRGTFDRLSEWPASRGNTTAGNC
jgi:hypothetical protein